MVLVGVIAGAHGVRGAVRVKSFTDAPESVAAYGPLFDESGERRFDLRLVGSTKGGVIAQLSGVSDRNAAEALRGQRLYVPRQALPETDEEEFYHADLIGLRAVDETGEEIGRITAVHNFGAGDMLEIRPRGGKSVMVPFTKPAVPTVSITNGMVTVNREMAGLLDKDEDAPAGQDQDILQGEAE